MAFLNNENSFRHHLYDEEMLQYEYLKEGNLKAIEEGTKMFSSSIVGNLSENPLRHWKYLFVASITLATRFAIQCGLDSEFAYNASDLYIKKVDLCNDIKEIKTLQKDMFTFFTTEVSKIPKKEIYSKPIVLFLDYINYHLYEQIKINQLAEHVNLNPNYLYTLFKNEVGISISNYIINKRIEVAENRLKFSNYTYAEISSILAFNSQSYFTKQFKTHLTLPPKNIEIDFSVLVFLLVKNYNNSN